MEAKIVSIKELTHDNPTFCLSPLRVFDKCHQCKVFKKAYNHDRIGKLKCKPHIPNNLIDLLKKKQYILDQLAIINSALEG